MTCGKHQKGRAPLRAPRRALSRAKRAPSCAPLRGAGARPRFGPEIMAKSDPRAPSAPLGLEETP